MKLIYRNDEKNDDKFICEVEIILGSVCAEQIEKAAITISESVMLISEKLHYDVIHTIKKDLIRTKQSIESMSYAIVRPRRIFLISIDRRNIGALFIEEIGSGGVFIQDDLTGRECFLLDTGRSGTGSVYVWFGSDTNYKSMALGTRVARGYLEGLKTMKLINSNIKHSTRSDFLDPNTSWISYINSGLEPFEFISCFRSWRMGLLLPSSRKVTFDPNNISNDEAEDEKYGEDGLLLPPSTHLSYKERLSLRKTTSPATTTSPSVTMPPLTPTTPPLLAHRMIVSKNRSERYYELLGLSPQDVNSPAEVDTESANNEKTLEDNNTTSNNNINAYPATPNADVSSSSIIGSIAERRGSDAVRRLSLPTVPTIPEEIEGESSPMEPLGYDNNSGFITEKLKEATANAALEASNTSYDNNDTLPETSNIKSSPDIIHKSPSVDGGTPLRSPPPKRYSFTKPAAIEAAPAPVPVAHYKKSASIRSMPSDEGKSPSSISTPPQPASVFSPRGNDRSNSFKSNSNIDVSKQDSANDVKGTSPAVPKRRPSKRNSNGNIALGNNNNNNNNSNNEILKTGVTDTPITSNDEIPSAVSQPSKKKSLFFCCF